MKQYLDNINDEYLEFISFILLVLWAISPIVEYAFKNIWGVLYTFYFSKIVYVIGIIGIITYIVYLIKENKKEKLTIKKFFPQILILILIFLGIISSIFSSDPHLSIFGESYRKEGLIVYIMYVGIILSASILKNKKYFHFLINLIIVSALLITILPLFKNNFTYNNFTNIYHNTNHYGYFLMIAVMLIGFEFIKDKRFKKYGYLLGYVFLLYMLIMNNTFGCFLAIIISLSFLLIYSLIKKVYRKDILILIFTFILTSVLVSVFNIQIGERTDYHTSNIIGKNIASFSNDVKTIITKDAEKMESVGSSRGILWKGAWDYTLKHPIIGGGMENISKYYWFSMRNKIDRPHNIILQVSSFIGIPGAIIYLVLIFFLAFANLKKLKDNFLFITIYVTAMCYFISSMFGNSMYYTSPYFMILIGFLIGMYQVGINKKENSFLN